MENEVKTDIRPEAEQTEGNITVKRNKTLDFLAKIICLLLAFFLWYYAVSVDAVIYEEEFSDIPVEIVNRSGFAVLSGDGMTIDVTLSGNRNAIRKLKNSDIRAYVDVSNVTEAGEKLFDIQLKLPGGVSLLKTSTGTIPIYLDNKVSKTVPVEAKPFDYSISSEYSLHLSEIPSIVVTGPEQIVNTISRAELPVDLKGEAITSGRKYSGKVILIGQDGSEITGADRRYLLLSSDTASVTVSLRGSAAVPITVSFKNGVQKPENCVFDISRDTIRVYGDVSIIKDLSVNCVIDEKTLKNGDTVNCVIGLPSGVQNLDNVTSLSVTVTLKNYAETELTVPVFDTNGNRITSLTAQFRGESAVIPTFSLSSVKATVNIPDGETSGIVSFEILGEFAGRVYEIYSEGSPYTVSVNNAARRK